MKADSPIALEESCQDDVTKTTFAELVGLILQMCAEQKAMPD